jgi:hypothetical protein
VVINFRYHLVSLISVFLALAIGIALGAGPLKGPIDSGLSDQVASLREDKDALREEVRRAEADVAYREGMLAGLMSGAVRGLLPGTGVAVLRLAGADHGEAEALEAALRASGARPAASLELTEEWFALAEEDLRRRAATLARSLAPAPLAAVATRSGPEPRLRASAEESLADLREAGLVKGDTPDVGAEAVILLLPTGLARQGAEEDEDWARQDAAGIALAAAVGRMAAAVVAGPGRSGADLVNRIRAEGEVAEQINTVDGDSPPALAITALRAASIGLQGMRGRHYGPDAGSGAAGLVAPDLPIQVPEEEAAP